MVKLGAIHRFLLGRPVTMAMNLLTLFLITLVTISEVQEWAVPRPLSATVEAGSNEGHSGFARQGAVGVVLVALGVILEGMSTFVHRVKKVHQVEHLPGQDEFNDICELFVFYLLVLGLLIECFGELVKYLDIHQGLGLYAISSLSLALNAIAMVTLLRLCLHVLRLRLTM